MVSALFAPLLIFIKYGTMRLSTDRRIVWFREILWGTYEQNGTAAENQVSGGKMKQYIVCAWGTGAFLSYFTYDIGLMFKKGGIYYVQRE